VKLLFSPHYSSGCRAYLGSLTFFGGIGEVRARKLAEAGIDSVAKLAEATPQVVTLATGVIEKVALEFIAEAKKLIGLK
jgi:predicted RecB family nuclease